MTLTNADLAAIRERYKQCVHESDYADLAEHTPALLDTIDELREVLAEMATTPPLGSSVHREWDKRIARARAVLARMEGTP